MNLLARILLFVLIVLQGMGHEGVPRALGIESIRVPLNAQAIDLTKVVERYSSKGDSIKVETAPGADGIVQRIEVGARQAGSAPAWIVFALTNDTDEVIERLVVAPHFHLVGSGILMPDLGSVRISGITASQGMPEEEDSPDADVYRLTLDPGSTVTYIAELKHPNLPQLYLWEPTAYKDKTTSLTLYKGIVIGIAGLLALFLTIIFVVKGGVVFPAAAALAWAVLIYVCINFGFWDKVFGLRNEIERIWRASAEAILAATLGLFLFSYLNLSRWHVRYAWIVGTWLSICTALVALAVYDAPVAAGLARISIASIAGIGFILVIYLATHRYDRAVLLIPTWIVLVMWVVAAAFTVLGTLTNDLVAPALSGGLVLIILLIGFTIMQSAFAGAGLMSGTVTDSQRKALALTGSGDIIFDWDVPSDHIHVSAEIESQLGLKHGALEGPASAWFAILHPFDQDRYRAALDVLLEQRRGRLVQDFRLQSADGYYLWYSLKARPLVDANGDVLRIVGTLGDVTHSRRAEERLLQDAVRDKLTQLPNRELFLDRLQQYFSREQDENIRPTVLLLQIDHNLHLTETIGLSATETVFITLARRFGRFVRGGEDTLARFNNDCFAILLISETESENIVALADTLRSAVNLPILFENQEINLTSSIGLALLDTNLHNNGLDLLQDTELALLHAQRLGGDRIEVFRHGLRAYQAERLTQGEELREALRHGEIFLEFQPIVRIEDHTIAGFSALLRWNHTTFNHLRHQDLLKLAEDAGILPELSMFVLNYATRELAAWQNALEVHPPIFATLNLSIPGALNPESLQEMKSILRRSAVIAGSLKLEWTESVLLDNPEQASHMLQNLSNAGAGLILNDFGCSYASLGYLHQFPFDTIKLSASSVRQLERRGENASFLRSVIALIHTLGRNIIADGVEVEDDLILLEQLKCQYARGRAFGPPMDFVDTRRFMGAASEAA